MRARSQKLYGTYAQLFGCWKNLMCRHGLLQRLRIRSRMLIVTLKELLLFGLERFAQLLERNQDPITRKAVRNAEREDGTDTKKVQVRRGGTPAMLLAMKR